MRSIDPALFPNVVGALREAGLDPTRETVPVAPAAHYTIGGIVSDLHGRSGVAGLYAVGETACTGLHGANRLASNSLSECFVFGRRAALAALDEPVPTSEDSAIGSHSMSATARRRRSWGCKPLWRMRRSSGTRGQRIEQATRTALWEHAGIVRSGGGLGEAVEGPASAGAPDRARARWSARRAAEPTRAATTPSATRGSTAKHVVVGGRAPGLADVEADWRPTRGW